MPVLIEACVDSLASALAATRGGADRLELCDNLADAGTTPSHGVFVLALEQAGVPVFPMVRPRGGGFVYDATDVAVMRADLQLFQAMNAKGAVVGALTADGDVDEATIAALRGDARDMQLTFHRAFDVCRDPFAALDTLIRLGIDRLLTSGQRQTAWEGRMLIGDLVRAAAGRIIIMAGSGVNAANAVELVGVTGVTEVHLRGAMLQHDVGRAHDIRFRSALPADELARQVTDVERISAVKRAIS